jgi:hypothetical protein
MNCLECQECLHKRLDGYSLPSSQALDQHLSQCAECRDIHLAAQMLQDGMRQLPKPKVAANFARDLAGAVMRERRHRQAKVRQRVAITVGLAASVLFVLALGYLWMPPNKPKDPIAKEQPKQSVPPNSVPETKQPKEHDSPQPFVGLPERMADATRNHAQVFLVAANLDGVEKLPAVQDLPTLDPGMREAGHEVSEGVLVVTRNARKAFDFFARELPMPENIVKTD